MILPISASHIYLFLSLYILKQFKPIALIPQNVFLLTLLYCLPSSPIVRYWVPLVLVHGLFFPFLSQEAVSSGQLPTPTLLTLYEGHTMLKKITQKPLLTLYLKSKVNWASCVKSGSLGGQVSPGLRRLCSAPMPLSSSTGVDLQKTHQLTSPCSSPSQAASQGTNV